MSHMLLMSFDHSRMINLNNTLNRFMEYAFFLLQKKNIKFCYIGTASNDNVIERLFFSAFIRAKFGKTVRTSSLLLTKTHLTQHQIENYLSEQDILFIGGGNTEKMLGVWEKSGFTDALNNLKLQRRLPILAGVSAGGMYPFHSGLSHSTPGQYKPLSCLNWFKDSFCAHANSKIKALCRFENNKKLERLDAFSSAIKLGLLPSGYAVPNDCMLHFFDFNLVSALTTQANTHCYYVTAERVNPIETLLLTTKNIFQTVHDNNKTKQSLMNEAQILFRSECWRNMFTCLNVINRFVTLFRRFRWA